MNKLRGKIRDTYSEYFAELADTNQVTILKVLLSLVVWVLRRQNGEKADPVWVRLCRWSQLQLYMRKFVWKYRSIWSGNEQPIVFHIKCMDVARILHSQNLDRFVAEKAQMQQKPAIESGQ